MDNNNEKKETSLPDFIKERLEAKRNHVDTPSVCKLAVERDITYDKIQMYRKKVESDKQNGADVSFTEMQIQQLEVYKNMLGDQIKKLVDET